MRANELRVGNLIRWISTGDIDTVKDIATAGKKYHNINNVNISDCEEIELTEEWLLSFGFEKLKTKMSGFPAFKKDNIVLLNDACQFNCCIADVSPATHVITNFVYVHELQNFWFALTNVDLKRIK